MAVREIKLGDGKILHLPDTPQRKWPVYNRFVQYVCDCHKTLGDDYLYLPTGSCLRADKRCNREAV